MEITLERRLRVGLGIKSRNTISNHMRDYLSLEIPFKQGDTIVELGGGNHPLQVDGVTVVNVDKRPLPLVNQ